MLAIHLSLAAIAVAVLALWPRRNTSAAVVAMIAVVELALGAPGSGAISVVGPVIAFLAAAMTLAAIANHSGLGDRAARHWHAPHVVISRLCTGSSAGCARC